MSLEKFPKTWFSGIDMTPDYEQVDLCMYYLRDCKKDERLVMMMQFPEFYNAAKKDLLLRSTIISDSGCYLARRMGQTTENMKLFCRRLREDFVQYDLSIPLPILIAELKALSVHDLCTDAVTNINHRKIIVLNDELKTRILDALDKKISENKGETSTWEYLTLSIRNNEWNPSTVAQQRKY